MPIELPDDWSECERGNTLLSSSDGMSHVAYIELPSGHLLEVSLAPENYPALNVQVLPPDTRQKTLAHIGRLVYDDHWVVRKCNLGEIPGRFVRVEYDARYAGGDYDGVGEYAYIPVEDADKYSVPVAFYRRTGLSPTCLIHWSDDQLYYADGTPVENGE